MVVAIVALVAGFGLTATPSGADPFGYPNPGFVADGPDHWYCLLPHVKRDGELCWQSGLVGSSFLYLKLNSHHVNHIDSYY